MVMVVLMVMVAMMANVSIAHNGEDHNSTSHSPPPTPVSNAPSAFLFGISSPLVLLISSFFFNLL